MFNKEEFYIILAEIPVSNGKIERIFTGFAEI